MLRATRLLFRHRRVMRCCAAAVIYDFSGRVNFTGAVELPGGIAAAQRALQDPEVSGFAHMIMGQAYCEQWRYEEAIAALQKSGDATSLLYTYGVAGKRAQAEQALSVLQERARRRYVPAYNFAVAYAGLGDKNKALEWLEKAYEERSSNLITLRSDRRLKTLRGDPRFAAIVRRLRMPG